MRWLLALVVVLLGRGVPPQLPDRPPSHADTQDWNRALGVGCDHCHTTGRWTDASKPQFATAQNMAKMVTALNSGPLKDVGEVACWTCHRGSVRPSRLPREQLDAELAKWPAALKDSPESTRLTMAVYNVTLGVDCGHCHTLDDWTSAAKAPMKLVPTMNAMFKEFPKYMPSTARTQCYMCHKGAIRPELRPRPEVPGSGFRVLVPGFRQVRSVTARWMVDVERGVRIENAVVVIEGDRIADAGPRSAVAPRGAITELGDVTLLPGLIDAHVHLLLGGAPEANARATLMAGFTTVQDLGALNYANIKLRDDIAGGKVVGPRVVAAGPWLGISGGTCDFQGIGVKGADAFRDRVRKDVAAGADLIKVCASGWLPQAVRQPDAYEISDDELRAAIDEAQRAKRRVAVHALSERAISAAVAHGAHLIVHAGFTPGAALAEMQRRNVWQLPTLWSLKRANPADVYERVRAHMAGAAADKLGLAFGTDAGVIPHGANANEFLELEALGLTKAAAIRAATVNGARAVGMPKDVGRLAPGAFADVIAVRGNPLDDLRALQQVTYVMKGGVAVSKPTAHRPLPTATQSRAR